MFGVDTATAVRKKKKKSEDLCVSLNSFRLVSKIYRNQRSSQFFVFVFPRGVGEGSLLLVRLLQG